MGGEFDMEYFEKVCLPTSRKILLERYATGFTEGVAQSMQLFLERDDLTAEQRVWAEQVYAKTQEPEHVPDVVAMTMEHLV